MMHDIVIDELERHLSGNASKTFYDHLEACKECRAEVAEMKELSRLVAVFKEDREPAPEPSLGFFNRVAARIEEKQAHQAFGLFNLSEQFFRRIAFASLMLLAAMGSYLVTRESSFSSQDAVAIMADHDPSVAHAEGQDRDHMFVTLASYNDPSQ